jgi:hypothetical protein
MDWHIVKVAMGMKHAQLRIFWRQPCANITRGRKIIVACAYKIWLLGGATLTSSGLLGGNEIKTGLLKRCVPGAPDEVTQKSAAPCERSLENTQPTFVLLIEQKVQSSACKLVLDMTFTANSLNLCYFLWHRVVQNSHLMLEYVYQ